MPSKKTNPAFTNEYKMQCHTVFNQIEQELGVRDPGLALVVINTDRDYMGYALIKYTCKNGQRIFSWLKLKQDFSNTIKSLVPKINNNIDFLYGLLSTVNRISPLIQHIDNQVISNSGTSYNAYLVNHLTLFDEVFRAELGEELPYDLGPDEEPFDPGNIFDEIFSKLPGV